MKRFNFVILVALFGWLTNLSAQQVRSEFLLEKNWKFTREDNPDFIKPAFDDSKWAIGDGSARLGDIRSVQFPER